MWEGSYLRIVVLGGARTAAAAVVVVVVVVVVAAAAAAVVVVAAAAAAAVAAVAAVAAAPAVAAVPLLEEVVFPHLVLLCLGLRPTVGGVSTRHRMQKGVISNEWRDSTNSTRSNQIGDMNNCASFYPPLRTPAQDECNTGFV